MAVSSLSSTQSINSAAYQQVQQQQAQRNADQAVQAARSLQAQARSAQSAANRAQENARSISAEASQADSRASQAQQGLLAMRSMSSIQSGFDNLRQQISSVLSNEAPVTEAVQPAPVVNTSGQQTGVLISVTA